MLFEEKTRTFSGRIRESQSDWSYLDASADPWAGEVRRFLNEWVSEFPEGENRNELIRRFRSGNDENFRSAAFELILFAILRSLGCTVSVHPELSNGSSKRPDFLAVTPDGESIYIEAVKASHLGSRETNGEKMLNGLYEYLDEMDCPNFNLHAHPEGFPKRPPQAKKLRGELTRWLATLDPDEVSQRFQANEIAEYPEYSFESDGFRISFSAIPKAPERRGSDGRVVKLRQGAMMWCSSQKRLRDVVKEKGKRYGELPHPLLIAVNFDGWGLDDEDVVDALFGETVYLYRGGNSDTTLEVKRRRNGASQGPHGPRISGIWVFKRLQVWSLTNREIRIYTNHLANFRLPSLFSSFPCARVEDGQVVFSEGQSLESVLGIDADC